MEFGQTVINPIALLFTLAMCITILFVKKENMIIPVIFVVCFITQLQRIVFFGIDLPMIRIILIVGFLKILFSQEKSTIIFNEIDKIIIFFIVFKITAHTMLWTSASALIYMLGQGVEILGTYFLVRLTINDLTNYDLIIKSIILSSVPIAMFMIIEQVSGGRNYFSIFGGVREFDLIRDGRLRAQAAFSHPILAGTFGALVFPYAWGFWHRSKKFLALCGFVCSIIIVVASSSSGPVLSLIMGLFSCFFWYFNKYTKTILKLFLLLIVLLQLLMKAPVWHLISRINVIGGSTGYHRFRLIDSAINNFFSWCVVGIKDTSIWGRGLQDITNQYILEGVQGGIISVILFIVIIIKCFKYIGTARIRFGDKLEQQRYIWSLGCVMFVHIITFISVSYFGQIVIFYYLQVGMISSLNSLPEIVGKNNL